MNIREFDYDLPPELIAQEPLAERDRSRMLLVNKQEKTWLDSSFAEFPTFFTKGDVVVINNTRVFPARLIGHRILKDKPGALVEILLIRPIEGAQNEWETLTRPGRALREGSVIEFGNGRLRGTVTAIIEEGRRRIHFVCNENFDQIVDDIGSTPLPPYIKRDYRKSGRLDEPQYQTVYARHRGAIAAPTAGLHFTPRILDELKARGIRIAEITHHVGYPTFQPIRVNQIEDHHIASESYQISKDSAETINFAKQTGNRIIAVGTTTVRALESAAEEDGQVRAEHRNTELFIRPGFRFRVIDALLTNFHLPESSLLILVSAFGGHQLVLNSYRHAVEERYRFYSYGDCMLLI